MLSTPKGTCTNDGWNVSSCSGSDRPGIHTVSVFKVITWNPWKVRRGQLDGREYTDRATLDRDLLVYGYTQPFRRMRREAK